MPLASPETLPAAQRENAYLKQRCAQLEGDVADLGAQVGRLTQQLERVLGQRTGHMAQANPLSGGQQS